MRATPLLLLLLLPLPLAAAEDPAACLDAPTGGDQLACLDTVRAEVIAGDATDAEGFESLQAVWDTFGVLSDRAAACDDREMVAAYLTHTPSSPHARRFQAETVYSMLLEAPTCVLDAMVDLTPSPRAHVANRFIDEPTLGQRIDYQRQLNAFRSEPRYRQIFAYLDLRWRNRPPVGALAITVQDEGRRRDIGFGQVYWQETPLSRDTIPEPLRPAFDRGAITGAPNACYHLTITEGLSERPVVGFARLETAGGLVGQITSADGMNMTLDLAEAADHSFSGTLTVADWVDSQWAGQGLALDVSIAGDRRLVACLDELVLEITSLRGQGG